MIYVLAAFAAVLLALVAYLVTHRAPAPIDTTPDLFAALLARLHEVTSDRIDDVQDQSDAHLNALADLSNAWAERYCTQLDANLAAHRETLVAWSQDVRLRQLDDVRALIAQTPSATNYAIMDRTAQVREPGEVGERAADVEEARLRPWRARRRQGMAMDDAEGAGRVAPTELHDEYGDPIVPIGAGG